MYHKVAHEKGNDARNHIARCICGWAHCSTYKQCQLHAAWHVEDAVEERLWNDSKRQYQSRQ